MTMNDASASRFPLVQMWLYKLSGGQRVRWEHVSDSWWSFRLVVITLINSACEGTPPRVRPV